MANTYLKTTHNPYQSLLICDGCRDSMGIRTPMESEILVNILRTFDADHTNCINRPVKFCQFVDGQDGTCSHENNFTPECSLDVCPLLRGA